MDDIFFTPIGWEKKTLGQILVLIRNGYSGQQVNTITTYPVTRIETIANGYLDLERVGYVKNVPKEYRLQLGDILLSNINSIKHIGKVAIVNNDVNMYHGMNLLILRASEEVEPYFLYYLLVFHKKWFEKVAAQAINQASINQTTLKELELCIPLSKHEQGKISDILLEIDDVIEHSQKLINKYKRIKAGMMQDLLTRGIDEEGNIRSEETHEFRDSLLGRIPMEWGIEKLGSLVEAIDPQPDHRTPPVVANGVPYVGISDFLENGNINTSNCRRVGINVFKKQNSSFSIEKGDLIFGKIGTIGKPKQLPEISNEPYTLSANVILLKPQEAHDFIYWTLTSEYINRQVSLEIHSTSQPAFGMGKIRDLNIKVPPLNERKKIADKLNKLESHLKAENQKLQKLKKMKTGLMHDLLTGKVRITDLKLEDVGVK